MHNVFTMERIYEDTIGDYLSHCLEWSVASEETRRMTQDYALHIEILRTTFNTLYCTTEIEFYVVGSCGEGTTTSWVGSDADFIVCEYLRLVQEDPPDNLGDHDFFLINRDSRTKPGYVLLKRVTEKVSKTTRHREHTDESVEELDNCQEHVRINTKVIDKRISFRQGPADKIHGTEGTRELDHVFAFKSKSIPSFARQWLHRTRHFNWPSSDQLSEFESSECFFVGVGHPDSGEYRQKREWRISFTLQERELMYSLNPTQHKCYFLLKMVKKNIIQETIGESITSYHCKTALFYTIENSPCEFWVPENLVKCVRSCIFRMLVWSIQGHCPNYFIPDENMFDKIECRNKLHIIRCITLQIIQSGFTFLLKLGSDTIGSIIREFIANKPSVDKSNLVIDKMSLQHDIYLNKVYESLSMRNDLLSRVNTFPGGQVPNVKFKMFINKYKKHFSSTTKVKQHTKTVVNQAFEPILLFDNLQKAQYLASELFDCQDDARIKQEYLTRVLHFTNESRSWDALSADLIEATVYYRLNMFEECRDKLTRSLTFGSYVNSWCVCSFHQRRMDIFILTMIAHFYKELHKTRSNTMITMKTYRQTYISTCLAFLPSQRLLVHPILHLEMFRSYGETGDEGNKSWHEWIMIDSKIYFYFLKYLLHTKLEDMTQKQAAIDDMWFILKEDPNLGHRDTAYNMLSWMYRQENKMGEAYPCLCESWKVKSGHNAAKWHLALLLWDLWKVRKENGV